MRALVVVDMQNDFMPGGPLGVEGADLLVPRINYLMEKFPLVVATKDWHPSDHMSFAKNHAGKEVGDVVKGQILWPVHCVQNTKGAEFVAGLDTSKFERVFFKGVDKEVDSYSTFFDNEHKKDTGLFPFLQEKNVREVYFAGVATEYCVLYSVLDALELGLDCTVIADGCKPIDKAAEKEAFYKMEGARILLASEVEK